MTDHVNLEKTGMKFFVCGSDTPLPLKGQFQVGIESKTVMLFHNCTLYKELAVIY